MLSNDPENKENVLRVVLLLPKGKLTYGDVCNVMDQLGHSRKDRSLFITEVGMTLTKMKQENLKALVQVLLARVQKTQENGDP